MTVRLLAAALGVALVVIAFLLGRESVAPVVSAPVAERPNAVTETEASQAEPAPAPPSVPAEPAKPVEPEEPAEIAEPAKVAKPPEPAVPLEAGTVRLEVDDRGEVSISKNAGSQKPSASSGLGSEKAEVEAYFAKMKSISSGELVQDPGAFAIELVQAATKGDTSGFDRLIKDSDAIHRSAKAVTPPASCREHHATSLELLAESRALLVEMRDAIKSGNISSLSSMTTKAQALQERAQDLEAQEKRIRAAS